MCPGIYHIPRRYYWGSTKHVLVPQPLILSYKNNEGINGTGMACSIRVPSLNFIHLCVWKLGMGFLVTHTWFRSGGLQRLEIFNNFSATIQYCPVKRSPASIISHIWTGEGQRSCSSTNSIDHYRACTISTIRYLLSTGCLLLLY